MEKPRPSLEEVFSPRGVAVVGASASGNDQFVRALQEAGFPAIYPVNPNYTEVYGLPCYPSVKAIPGIVDHVIVRVPADSALALLDDCAAKGVRSVHFFTAGFSETGSEERGELERAMLEKARAGGLRIIGPNCLGLFVPGNHLSTVVFGEPLEPGPIGFLSQSGGNAQIFLQYYSPMGLRISKMVSYGNALDVDESELLEYFARDPETEIIAAYIEGIRDGRRFFNALREAASRKPVVIYKGGTTEAGRRATFGHTASLSSSATVFEALCRQMKAILVDDMDELVDVLAVLNFARPLPKGTGVLLMGGGGGPSVLGGDEIEKGGLRVPPLSEEVQAGLKQFFPLAGSIFVNPLDISALTSAAAISKAMSVLGKVTDIDMFIYHLGFHPIGRWGGGRFSSDGFLRPVIDTLGKAQQAIGKPVLFVLKPALDMDGTKEFLTVQEAFVNAGFPVFHSLGKAAKAIARVVAWNQA